MDLLLNLYKIIKVAKRTRSVTLLAMIAGLVDGKEVYG
jgi:hypothetical protein